MIGIMIEIADPIAMTNKTPIILGVVQIVDY